MVKPKNNIDKYYGGDVYAYCEDYYDLMADVYNKTRCDIIGHFDLITKFNEVAPMIDESEPRYVSAVNKALSVLVNTPATFEVNTGAISRGYRTKPYPNDEILNKLRSLGKKFIINSDTHSTATIDCKLEEVADSFDKSGIKYITRLEEIL